MRRSIAVLVVGFATSAALSGPETTFTYQGVLEETGQPVTGMRTLRFSLTTDATGASVSASLTRNVDVAQGQFTVPLDFGGSIVQAYANVDGDPQWYMLVEVQEPDTSFTKLLPPQPLSGVPFSTNTRGVGVDAENNVFIENTLIAGDSEAHPDSLPTAFNLDLGDGLGRQSLLAFTPAPSIVPYARLGLGPTGFTGALDLTESTGNTIARLAVADTFGINAGLLDLHGEPGSSGGVVRLRRSQDDTASLLLEGGVDSPKLTMSGQFHSLHIDLDQFEDASVVLPLKSISSPEILNEAGATWQRVVDHPLSVDQVCSPGQVPFLVDVYAPSDGVLIAMFSGTVDLTHADPSASPRLIYNWRHDGFSIVDAQFTETILPPAAALGSYTLPIGMDRIIPVTEGNHTVGLGICAFPSLDFPGEDWNLREGRLIVLFFPTIYAPVGGASDAPATVSAPATTQSDRHIASRVADLEAENAELRDRLDEQQAMLEHLLQKAGVTP